MNALIEFIILTGGSFFLFMFLAYKDALRTKAPSGPVASLLNNIKGWEYTDKKGVRGYLFRQPLWMKFVISVMAALIIRIVYAIFFDFAIATETFNIFTGFSAWLFHSGLIFVGIMLSYMWPRVQNKIVDIKDDAIKGAKDIKQKTVEKVKTEELAEKPEEIKPKESPEPEKVDPPKKDKDDPNDIINEYLN